MTETYYALLIEFETIEEKEKGVEFLSDEGPDFEEDADPRFRHLYFLQDDIEEPDLIYELESKIVVIEYESGAEGYLELEEMMEICADKKGIQKVYGYFSDDESNHIFLKLVNGVINQIYEITEDSEESDLNDQLLDFETDELMMRIASLYP